VPVLPRGGINAEEDDLRAFECELEIVGEDQPTRIDCVTQPLVKTWLIERSLTSAEALQLFGIDFYADYLVSEGCHTGSDDRSYVSATNDCNAALKPHQAPFVCP
jgi:hypothetical protein